MPLKRSAGKLHYDKKKKNQYNQTQKHRPNQTNQLRNWQSYPYIYKQAKGKKTKKEVDLTNTSTMVTHTEWWKVQSWEWDQRKH